MGQTTRRRAALVGLVALLGALATVEGSGCGASDPAVAAAASGAGGAGGAGTNSGGGDTSLSVGPSSGAGMIPCDTPCMVGEICSHGICVPQDTTCKTDNDCSIDTYCDPATGCIPWDNKDPAHDPDCINVIAAGILSPKVKCEFAQAP